MDDPALWLAALGDEMARVARERDRWPVARRHSPRAVVEALAPYDFAAAIEPARLVAEIGALLARDVQTASPRYLGYAGTRPGPAAVTGEALAALYNPQLAVWSHAPLAIEIERHVLRFVARHLGITAEGRFTTGATEANLVALVTALTRQRPDHAERGLAGPPPRVYASRDAHGSLVRAAHVAGVGRKAIVPVATDAAHRLVPEALARAIEDDLRAGASPLMIVATLGTTSTGALDPVPPLVALARRFGLWLHVDAAYGGVLGFDPRRVHELEGVGDADSVCFDAHKALFAPRGAGMLFTPHRDALRAAFAVATPYLPGHAHDPVESGLMWSRRFIGLPLFMALAAEGEAGLVRRVQRSFDAGEALRAKLGAAGFRILNDTPLPIVCFNRPGLVADGPQTHAIAKKIVASGRAWLSDLRLSDGGAALRAAIHDGEVDLDALVDDLLILSRGRPLPGSP